jgi:hypothetical protein
MIHMIYKCENNLQITLYRDDINREDITYSIARNIKFYQTLEKDKQIIALIDFRTAKAVNSDLYKMLADFGNEYGHLYSKIYITGLSAFLTILFRSYLALSKMGDKHIALKEPYEIFLEKEGIAIINEENIFTQEGYLGSSRDIKILTN